MAAAQAKITSISEECFLETVLILIVCLFLVFRGGLVLKREQKRGLFLIHGKIFHLVDPFQHRDIFSKELLGEFCQLQPIQRS